MKLNLNLQLFADNVKPDRTADDLLAQIMLDWGLSLSLKIEQITIAGKQVFQVAEDSLLACFDNGLDENVAKEIAKLKEADVVSYPKSKTIMESILGDFMGSGDDEQTKLLKNITPQLLYMKQLERIQSLGVYQYKMPFDVNVR